MAGAGVALNGGGSFAADNNIAALSSGAGVSYTMWQPKNSGASIISASAAYSLGKLSLGLNFKNFGQKEMAITSSSGQNKGSFKPSDMSIGLGAAYSISNYLSMGLAVKYASSKLGEDYSASTVAFDFGALYAKESLTVGLSVNNLGGKVKYDETSYSLPSLVKAGASYKISDLLLSAQFDMCFKKGMGFALGAEYGLIDMIYIRGGYRYGSGVNALPSFVSLGLGFKYAGFNLNATYLLASKGLNGTMAFGLQYSF